MTNRRYYNNPQRKVNVPQSWVYKTVTLVIGLYLLNIAVNHISFSIAFAINPVHSPVSSDWSGGVNERVIVVTATPLPTRTVTPSVTPLKSPTTTPRVKSAVTSFIESVFTEEPKIAVAVFTAESGLRADAIGYNCWFDKDGNVIPDGTWGTNRSGGCPTDKRNMAWSVDCGITQMNVKGQTCPDEYMNIEWNVTHAYEWKYKAHGFNPWVAYTNGHYKQFLTYDNN